MIIIGRFTGLSEEETFVKQSLGTVLEILTK